MAFDPNAGDSGPTNQSGNDDLMKKVMAALVAAGGGLAGRAISNSQGNPLTQAVPPQLSQLLDQSVQRQAYQNPLFQATTQGAYSMLPTFAKQGTQLSGSLSSTPPAAPASGGGGGGAAAGGIGLAALAGLLGPGGGGGSMDFGKILAGLKKLFSHNEKGVQGDKPYEGGALTGPTGPDPFKFLGFDPGPAPDPEPQGRVETNETFAFPNDVFNDPYLLNSFSNGMPNDPSGGTGIGPGMQDYYGSGGGSTPGNDVNDGFYRGRP